MSVGVASGTVPEPSRLGARLLVAAGAILLAGLVLAGLSLLLAPVAAPAPARSPFGMGLREAAPAATGLGGWILALQASFSRSLQTALAAIRAGGGYGPMLALGFGYGVFHAAGPGHGKAVIAGYLLAGERALLRGFTLSAAAALLQALVAIAIVGIGTLLLGATAATLTRAGTAIETVSFALVALLGLAMTWRKAGRLAAVVRGGSPAACAPDCGHVHLNDAAAVGRLDGWSARVGVVLAAGSRPCAGAILILVFSASQGMLAAGIAATFAMALGTALTTGVLASLAVFAKAFALRLAGGRGTTGAMVIAGLEVVAGAFVLVLGLAMLAGLSVGVGG
ncbi:nickel transporter [Methylobacterium sp. Leaf399]|uniref:nickel/cobalt transporter n=1 Tax=unclassified Methylobacterium TaxID=2615210 RepID=UPI0006FB6435|nr:MULTISPECIES: nickel transporter [unclassified Methylobacterium]KQP61711.1 nickel transporter [Methylobacterium sp. Leaf108]KQT19967.1 nickel transporter [Methylobacterium sp. Leaf399]